MSKEQALTDYKNSFKKEMLEALIEEHAKNPYTVSDYIKNKSNICFVFSCPGREELINDAVCQGETGDNLNILLEILKEMKPDIFKYADKSQYDILNATNVVHFYSLDGKTEGTTTEIKESQQRIKTYLSGNPNLQYVILCGNKAQIIEDTFTYKEDIKIIRVRHLGFQSINQILEDANKNSLNLNEIDDPKARTKVRLKVIAEDVVSQMSKKT